jgi:hypothetical protein
MNSTLTRLAAVIGGLFAAVVFTSGTAHADDPELGPFVEPLPHFEFCFEPDPEDCVTDERVILDDETEEPAEEPVDPPAEEPEPQQQPSGGQHGPSDSAESVPSSESDLDAQDDAIVAPVNDVQAQPASDSSGTGALLAVVAAGLALAAGGGITYAVARRR